MSRLTLKDPGHEGRIISERVIASCLFAGLLLAFILMRLAYLQLIEHEHYTTLSTDNQVKILPIAPKRGLIYSRDGQLVAENRPTFSLEVIPENVADIDTMLQAIRGIISLDEEDISRFRKALTRKRRFEKSTLKYDLNETEVARFAVNRHRYPGVDIVPRLIRYYPFHALFAHVLGYVGRINEQESKSIALAHYSGNTHIGKTGVELFYETALLGKVGHQKVEVNAQGKVLRTMDTIPPVAGTNLQLTLHSGLQSVAHKALGNRRGAVVVMDPNNGDVLALVSVPSYDPNPFVYGIDSSQFNKLKQSADSPLFNRALQGQYPPGSTVKPFLGLAGLHFQRSSLTSTVWCPGWFRLANTTHRYRCWARSGHGKLDLKQAIAQSCDVYFYQLALDLGIEAMHEILSGFGFGAPLGIDLPGAATGLLPSPQWKQSARHRPWYPGETLITGIGQGYMLATPLQLAAATAALANRGEWVTPRVLTRTPRTLPVTTGNDTVPPRALINVIEPEHWDTIIDAMIEVVHGPRGSARKVGKGLPFRVAGKTGTSQLFRQSEGANPHANARLKDHALFIAFAPAQAPRIALAVVIENGGSGSAAAAPVARQVLDYFFANNTVNPPST